MDDRLEVCQAWRRLMLNADGSLKDDAETVMRDLEKMTGWMVSTPPVDDRGATDPYRAVAALEKRGIFATVKRRLFENIEQLKRKAEHDG